jgi:hypothetical protein
MTKKSKTIGEQTSALLNKEVKNIDIYEQDAEDIYEPDESDIYEPDYKECEEQFDEFLAEELFGILEAIGYFEYLVDRYAAAERNLKALENIIIESIGKDSYEDMMDLIYWQKEWLKRDIRKYSEEYDSINRHTVNN